MIYRSRAYVHDVIFRARFTTKNEVFSRQKNARRNTHSSRATENTLNAETSWFKISFEIRGGRRRARRAEGGADGATSAIFGATEM